MTSTPPIDLVVMSLRNHGASVEEIARRAGLTTGEALGALARVASRFDSVRPERCLSVDG